MFAAHVMGCIICKLFNSLPGNGDESQLVVAAEGKKEYSWYNWINTSGLFLKCD
jgi:hypothetical protein